MKKFLTLAVAFVSICAVAYSQPANDDCSGATPISIPAGGSACVTGTSTGATPTTWTTAVCGQTSWTDDVWYTFVSTGTFNVITVSPSGNPAAKKIGIAVFTGGCASLGGQQTYCEESATNNGSDSIIQTAPAGTQFWIEVSGFAGDGGFQLCVSSTAPPTPPGSTCATASKICSLAPFNLASVPAGGTAFKPGCFRFTPSSTVWYEFTVGVSGTLAWSCQPTGTGVELDWALYDVTGGCPTHAEEGSYVACNYNFANEVSAPIGMVAASTTACPVTYLTSPGTPAAEFCDTVTAIAGHTYAIMISDYSYPTPTGWNFNFNGSTFKMAPVDTFLVAPDTTCGNTATVNLTNNSIGAIWQLWNFGDTDTSQAVNPAAHTYITTGTYFITLKDSTVSGCTALSSKSVIVAAYPTIVLKSDTICPGTSATLTAKPSVTGGKYLWSTGATTASITETPITNSSYTVTYTSAVGCSASASATIMVNTPAAAINPPAFSTCPGSGATLTATTGASYMWSNGATTGTVTVTPATNTVYTVTVTFTGGCTATASSSITISNNATTTITPATATVCNGGSTTLTAGTGTAYLWSTGATTPTVTVLPTTNTTYDVTVTVTGTCIATASASVTIATVTAAITPANATICSGGTATFTASPASSYSWTNSASTASITVSPLATTTYTVTATSAAGCTATASATVTVSNNIVASVTPQPDTICVNGSTTLTASTGDTYLWGDGSTTGSITVSPGANTNYSVTVSSGGTCTATATATVVVAPFAVTISPATSNICVGSPVTLTCSYHTNTYSWNPPQIGTSQGVVVSPPVTTTYDVTVTNSNNCTASASAVINVDQPSVTITPPSASVCSGQSTTLTASGASTYTWSNGPNTAANTVSPTATTTYVVSAVDAQGCPSTDSSVVSIGAIPTATFTAPAQICAGIDGPVTYTGTSSPAAVFNWNFNGATVDSGSGAGPYAVNWGTPGPNPVSLTVNDNGCVGGPDTMIVNVNGFPVANAGADTAFCSGYNVAIGTTGSVGYTYLWSPATGLSSATVSNPTVTLINSGNSAIVQPYIVTASQAGCSSSDTVIVTINSAPVANFASQPAQCLNLNKFNFVAGGSFLNSATFAWTFGNSATPATSTAQNPTVTYSVPQTTAVTLIISQLGCISNTYTDSVTVTPVPVAAFSADSVAGCPNLNVCFINSSIAIGNVSYLWTFGDGQISATSAPCHVYVTPGVYSVNLQVTANGCTDSSNKFNYIQINPTPVARFLPNSNTIQQPQSEIDFTNLSTSAATYLWNFAGLGNSSDVNPIFSFTQYGLYNVVLNAYSSAGCSDSFTLPIKVLPPQSYFIPNVFTPNNDGNNDNFYIEMQEGVTVQEFTVFDRWGEKVHDGLYPWDGTYKGKPSPQGVYVYVFKLQLSANSQPIRRTGSVTLVR